MNQSANNIIPKMMVNSEEWFHLSRPFVITVTGEYGSGCDQVASELADRLGLLCYDANLLDKMVTQSVTQASDKPEKEKLLTMMQDWLHGMFAVGKLKRYDYYLHLVKIVMEIAREGGVIIGNGAHLILANKNVFRLKVDSGVDFCSHRMAAREGISLKECRQKVIAANKEQVARVREIYRHFTTESTYYDLVLSAESLTPAQIVDSALEAMEELGIIIPGRIAMSGMEDLSGLLPPTRETVWSSGLLSGG